MLELLSAGKSIVDLVKGMGGAVKVSKKELLVNHVDPIQTYMQKIHKDYLESFLAVQKKCEKAKDGSYGASYQEILDLVRERQASFAYERDLAQSLAQAINNPDRGLPYAFGGADALAEYCKSIAGYFSVPVYGYTQNSGYSILRSYLEDESIPEKIKSPGEIFFAVGYCTKQVLKYLPEAIADVNKHYSELRLLLL